MIRQADQLEIVELDDVSVGQVPGFIGVGNLLMSGGDVVIDEEVRTLLAAELFLQNLEPGIGASKIVDQHIAPAHGEEVPVFVV